VATYSRVLLSGSTNGRPIPVVQTASPGTTIHTAVSGTSAYDELYLFVSNVTGSAANLTVEFGGTTDPGDHLVKQYSIPANSVPVPISTGICLQNALVCRAFSGTASALNITGFCNRIS